MWFILVEKETRIYSHNNGDTVAGYPRENDLVTVVPSPEDAETFCKEHKRGFMYIGRIPATPSRKEILGVSK